MSYFVSDQAGLGPSDVVGCRHRALLRRALGGQTARLYLDSDWENLAERVSSRISAWRRRSFVFAQLPTAPRIGDKLRPTRSEIADGDNAVEETLEALARGDRLILNPALEHDGLEVQVDLLVRMDPGVALETAAYAPVIITGHNATRSAKNRHRADCRVVSVDALGLGRPAATMLRHRTVASDAQRLGMANMILQSWGFASSDVGIIGRSPGAEPDGSRCYFFDAQRLYPGLLAAFSEPVPTTPSRVKECQTCEFHNHCRAQLLQTQDISLLLPGDRNRPWRDKGINTLPALAAAGAGEASALAAAWMRGEVAIRRPVQQWYRGPLVLPQGQDAVEIDVDMEAHPSRGTFLWGTFDGHQYVAFSDFSPTGDEGRHVAEMWDWLMWRRERAHAEGRKFLMWVYAKQGELYWLRHYARLYGGQEYGSPSADGGQRQVRMPTLPEVNEFIQSPEFGDVFEYVSRGLLGTGSLGLKTIAPLAGFNFSQEGVDGKAAVDLFEVAVATGGRTADISRRTLERYNADDCVATRTVRGWLRRGAPGISLVE